MVLVPETIRTERFATVHFKGSHVPTRETNLFSSPKFTTSPRFGSPCRKPCWRPSSCQVEAACSRLIARNALNPSIIASLPEQNQVLLIFRVLLSTTKQQAAPYIVQLGRRRSSLARAANHGPGINHATSLLEHVLLRGG